MKRGFLKNWEISMLLALCITLCAGVWAGAKSAAISAADPASVGGALPADDFYYAG